eukprot:UN00121
MSKDATTTHKNDTPTNVRADFVVYFLQIEVCIIPLQQQKTCFLFCFLICGSELFFLFY